MEIKNTIKIYTGKSIENKCGRQLPPYNDVLRAREIFIKNEKDNLIVYSNSPDFVGAMFNLNPIYGNKNLVLEFYLDGILQDGIETIFEDFNTSLSFMDKLAKPKLKGDMSEAIKNVIVNTHAGIGNKQFKDMWEKSIKHFDNNEEFNQNYPETIDDKK